MKLRNLAPVAAGMLFLAFTAAAQITTIEGVVKGADGKLIQNAVIKITRTDIKGNYETKSNKKGHYIYMGLPIGLYNLAVFVDGKQVDQTTNVKTSPGDARVVDFDLKASQQDNSAKAAQLQKAVETGGKIPDELARGLTSEQKAAM
jgi:hypothetical protein